MNTYAQALYGLAKDEGVSTPILEQMEVLNQAFAREPDFLRLLGAPELSKEARCKILDDSFQGRVEQYLLSFMKLLTEKGYIRQFPACCAAYREQYNEDHGILPVMAVSAVELTGQQKQKLTDKLCQLTGKTVELSCRVEPRVLGGVRLDYDGKRVDGTVQSRLEAVCQMLKNTLVE